MRDQRHGSGAARRARFRVVVAWLPDALVVLLVVAAFANLQFDLGRHWFGLDPAGADEPAAVRAPVGLDLPAGTAAPPVATTTPPGALDPAAVRRALAPFVRARDLGRHVDVAVSDLSTGEVVYRRGSGAVVPASTTKLLTAAAALEALGPMTRFTTSVRSVGDRIVLVGGGDPFLVTDRRAAKGLYPVRATLDDLAGRTAAALVDHGVTSVRLGYDDSLFTGPSVNPAWPATYLPDNVVPPITALWVDEGQDAAGRYVDDPSRAAATAFASALRAHGVTVRGRVRASVAAASSAELAAVHSAPLAQIVERTLAVSDNNAAEVIAHHVGLAVGHDASFTGGVAAVIQVLQRLGVTTAGSTLYDGSGLSRRNRLTTEVLLDVLRVASSAEHPRLRAVVTGLPVAGFVGSLQSRFDDAAASVRGRVRAKTGTLTGVSGLAGIVTDAAGDRMAFVAIADRISVPRTLAARHDLDLIAGALAACRCGAPS